ncbi:hypothetical protein [Opitutus sp. ER46]|uniref:hypothetical protein n=1 Tax=Opitutus sp. ER46 TaxID=2161864 RepID=UPI0011B202AE|nr:hypothetical protein [Opitutus sp. ER46]
MKNMPVVRLWWLRVLAISVLSIARGYAAVVEGATFELRLDGAEMTKASVVGSSAVTDVRFAPRSIVYHLLLDDTTVTVSEGAVTLPSSPDASERTAFQKRCSDSQFSVQTYVFKTASRWTASFIVGSKSDSLNFAQGVCLSASGKSPEQVGVALRRAAESLVLFVGNPIAPKRLVDLEASRDTRELFAFLGSPSANPTDHWEWCMPADVHQIAIASTLAQFPVPQGQLRSVIGTKRLPNLGGAGDDQGRACFRIVLTNPESSDGFYALRVHYGNVSPLPPPGEIPIEAAEVVFVGHHALEFVYVPGKAMRHMLPELKERMKREHQTPFELAAAFRGLLDEPRTSAAQK